MKWTGNVDEFLTTLDNLTVRNPTENHRKALSKFLINNAETVKELPLTAKQVKRISRYVRMIGTLTLLLEGSLSQSGGDADKFFAFFKAVAIPNPSETYLNALDDFFESYAETIRQIPFSVKQVEFMTNYTKRVLKTIDILGGYKIKYMIYDKRASTPILFLEAALERARGDGDQFLAIFNALNTPKYRSYPPFDPFFSPSKKHYPSEEYKNALKEFFLENAEAIFSLGLSSKQIQYIDRYIDHPSVSARILDASLKSSLSKNKENCAVNIATLFL